SFGFAVVGIATATSRPFALGHLSAVAGIALPGRKHNQKQKDESTQCRAVSTKLRQDGLSSTGRTTTAARSVGGQNGEDRQVPVFFSGPFEWALDLRATRHRRVRGRGAEAPARSPQYRDPRRPQTRHESPSRPCE